MTRAGLAIGLTLTLTLAVAGGAATPASAQGSCVSGVNARSWACSTAPAASGVQSADVVLLFRPSLGPGSEGPTSILQLYNHVGSPGTTANFAGQNQLNTQYFNETMASSTTPEAAVFLNLSSSVGSGTGNGAISAYKMGEAISVTASAGSANTYGANIAMYINSGVGAFSSSGLEVDVTNNNHDYPQAGYGGIFSSALSALADSNYKETSAFIIGSINANQGFHTGIWVNTDAISDYTIEDNGNSSYTYYDNGSHASAGFAEVSGVPIGFFAACTCSTAGFQDSSTAPYGMALTGAYSTAALATTTGAYGWFNSGTHSGGALYDTETSAQAMNLAGVYSAAAIATVNATTSVALGVKAGQSVCLDGLAAACVSYSTSAHKWYFNNSGGTNVWSVDDSGNARFSGTVTGSTTP